MKKKKALWPATHMPSPAPEATYSEGKNDRSFPLHGLDFFTVLFAKTLCSQSFCLNDCVMPSLKRHVLHGTQINWSNEHKGVENRGGESSLEAG